MGKELKRNGEWLTDYFNAIIEDPYRDDAVEFSEPQRQLLREIYIQFYYSEEPLFNGLTRPSPLQMFVLFSEEIRENSTRYEFLAPYCEVYRESENDMEISRQQENERQAQREMAGPSNSRVRRNGGHSASSRRPASSK